MSERDAPAPGVPSRAAPAWTPPGWTKGGFAYPALFVGSLIESTILPWPIEFPLLAVMLRGRGHVFPAALAVTAGSVLGCLAAFLVGALAYDAVAPLLLDHPSWAAAVEAARAKAEARGAGAVFIAMMAPAPVQIASFAAGVAGVGLWAFLAAAAAGRTIRYFAMAILVFAFGERIMAWWRARSTRARRIGLALIGVVFVLALIAAVMV
jgi:membrane protein YqaA with SNARE-associated domain